MKCRYKYTHPFILKGATSLGSYEGKYIVYRILITTEYDV